MAVLRDVRCSTDGEPGGNGRGFAVHLLSSGFVYFIRAGRAPAVKIGWALDPRKRLSELQTANHLDLALLGSVPGTLEDEGNWHARFQHLNIRGEWFTLADELREAINSLALGDGVAVQIQRRRRPALSRDPVSDDEVRRALDASEERNGRGLRVPDYSRSGVHGGFYD